MKYILIAFLLSYSTIALAQTQSNDFSKKSSLKQSGLDSMMMVEVEKNIRNGLYGEVTSVLIYHKGEVVFEKYYNGFRGTQLHTMRSGMKSITALLVGIAIQQKLIASEKEKVMDFYTDEKIENVDDNKRSITLEDVLKMASGIDWHEWSPPITDPANSIYQMSMASNKGLYVLNQKMDTLPNIRFLYNSGHSELLDDIILKTCKQNTAQFAQRNLFTPMGIVDFYWKDGSFTEQSSTSITYDKDEISLNLKPIDMLKLGVLVLQKGMWNGEPLVDSNWINKMLTPYFQPFPNTPVYYGYQWWMADYPTGFKIYNTSGSGDQYINVIPAMDMVVVSTARNFGYNPKIDAGAIRFDILKAHPLYKSLLLEKTAVVLQLPANDVSVSSSDLSHISSDLLDFGFNKEVIAITDIIVSRNEASYRTHKRRGKAFWAMNEFTAAKESFKKSLEMNPAVNYFEQQDAKECRKFLKKKGT